MTKKTKPTADEWTPDAQCLKLAIENVAQGAGAAIRQARADARTDLAAFAENVDGAVKVVGERLEALEQTLANTFACLMIKMGHPPTHKDMVTFAETLNIKWTREGSRALGLKMK